MPAEQEAKSSLLLQLHAREVDGEEVPAGSDSREVARAFDFDLQADVAGRTAEKPSRGAVEGIIESHRRGHEQHDLKFH